METSMVKLRLTSIMQELARLQANCSSMSNESVVMELDRVTRLIKYLQIDMGKRGA